MDIKKCSLFADVAETGNFTKSGERLGYTQSGVSHILKSLEEEVGFPLFLRTKQGVKLTANAQLLLPTVRSLLALHENLEQIINEINGLETGELTIATFASISIHWLPKIIHQFQQIYPNINIRLMEGGTDDIVKWVEDDLADFGFVSGRQLNQLEFIPLCDDPLMAILPKDYPVPESGCFNITDFQGQNFIISATGTDYDVHYALDTSKVAPNILFSSKDDHAIISMTANKLGISILPKLVIRNFENQILAYPLEPFYQRTLGIAVKSRAMMSPAAVKFFNLTKEMLPQLT
ncbi:MAG: LysR family transcriptional regulator [Fusicatenibacter sp.]|nr:LysR family transcriptional regulator [Fusicatenibacter sp.]